MGPRTPKGVSEICETDRAGAESWRETARGDRAQTAWVAAVERDCRGVRVAGRTAAGLAVAREIEIEARSCSELMFLRGWGRRLGATQASGERRRPRGLLRRALSNPDAGVQLGDLDRDGE
jgi:hypothetical protein